MANKLPLQQFSLMVERQPSKSYLHQPINGELISFSWADVDQQARSVAGELLKMGINPGERVGILSKNCAEWFIADLAIMMAGLISVPIYHTANRETIGYILENSDCKAIFVGKLDALTEADAGISASIPRLLFPYPSIEGQVQWASMIAGEPIDTLSEPNADDTMTIAYTSGSTGKPKGVVLSFENLGSAAAAAIKDMEIDIKDHLMSYLPLAHITERGLIESASFYAGCEIFFVESLETFMHDVKVAQPNVFISVPRLWTKFQSEILAKMPDKKLQILLKIPFVNKMVSKKIRIALGFNNARSFGSGTAPIAPSILRWFDRIGVPITEGWGMTETSGLSCANQPYDKQALGTIGKPLSCVEMKLGDNKEILIRGEAVFVEYYKNPAETAKNFTDGWFHTGDMGAITANGDFEIIGRIKEQFKTGKGKYVAPVPIESLIAQNKNIEQICVMGEGRKQPIVLVVMNAQNAQRNSTAHQSLLKTLEVVNAKLESHQRLDHIIVLKEGWTVENDLLTPTLKIKRSEIEAAYNHYLEADLDSPVIWE